MTPPTVHAAKAPHTKPRFQFPPGSADASESGRNTKRKPLAIHSRGKALAVHRRTVGIIMRGKNTPEMNWRIMNGGVAMAAADLALGISAVYAIPAKEQEVTPSRTTYAKVNQRPASDGIGNP